MREARDASTISIDKPHDGVEFLNFMIGSNNNE
jgi:hypothetical protein